jgi:hypothetical protein
VSPGLVAKNRRDSRLHDAVLSGELILRDVPAGVTLSQKDNLLFSKSRPGDPRPASTSILANRISRILGTRSEQEMIGTNAGRFVAVMHDDHSSWYLAPAK